MPAGFEFPRPETELWLPLEIDPAQARFGDFGPSGVARLRPGTTPAAAQADLDRLLVSSVEGAALEPGGFRARVRPLREDVVGDIGQAFWILLGTVGFILLIACANVSNLLIVRGEGRRRETAIHTALGASPRQLIGSVLLEASYPLLGKGANAWTVRQANVVLRTRVAPESLASEVRSAVWSIDPNVPVSGMRTMEQIFHRAQSRMIYSALMFVLATAVAMVLAVVGIYSFVSSVVSQRTAELGVRLALGARARDIRWLVLRESVATALAGVLAGLLGAVALTRWLGNLLFEISPLDPPTFILMPLLLLALVLLSSAVPAERAARVDPVKALQFS